MNKEFGKTIKNARLSKDLSLRDLAELTGLDHSYIGRLEKNNSVPSRETVAKLAKALNIPEGELMIKAGYVPDSSNELTPEQKIRAAVSGDPELLSFWQKLSRRPDLKLLMRQVKDMSPKEVKRIIRLVKAVEDEEAAEEF